MSQKTDTKPTLLPLTFVAVNIAGAVGLLGLPAFLEQRRVVISQSCADKGYEIGGFQPQNPQAAQQSRALRQSLAGQGSIENSTDRICSSLEQNSKNQHR